MAVSGGGEHVNGSSVRVKLGARTLHDSYILHSSFPVITEYISTTPLSVKQNKKLSTDINL